MNIKARFPGFKSWAGAHGDIDRITPIWRECLEACRQPYFAPVCTRFITYDVALDPTTAQYCRTIMAMPLMQEWIAATKVEPDDWVSSTSNSSSIPLLLA